MKTVKERYPNRFPAPCCGKCDFRDDLIMIYADGSDEQVEAFLQKSKIYVGNFGPLNLEKFEDCIPYFHHIMASGSFSKDSGNVIHLSSKSYIDIREEETLENIYNQVFNYYKKCQQIKKPMNWERFVRDYYVNDGFEKDNYRIIFNRFYEDSKNALKTKWDGLVTAWATSRRQDLLEYAKKNNCDLNHPELSKIVEKLKLKN